MVHGGVQHSAVDVMPVRPLSQSDMQRHSGHGELSKIPTRCGHHETTGNVTDVSLALEIARGMGS